MKANVALGAIGVERDLRPIEHHQQLWFVGVQPLEQTIERDEAGASPEDAVEASPQFATAPCGGFGAIRCSATIRMRGRVLIVAGSGDQDEAVSLVFLDGMAVRFLRSRAPRRR